MAMNFLPGMSEIRKIAAEGKYRVLPVSCEILSDICTPIEALDILKNVSAHCWSQRSRMRHGDAIPSWDLIPDLRSPAEMVK